MADTIRAIDGALELLVEAMRTHSDVADAQDFACYAMRTLAVNDGILRVPARVELCCTWSGC